MVRFVVDSMAGKLARWLRMLGFDAVYERTGEIERIIQIARDEKRVILTRNSRFKKVKLPKDVRLFFLSSEKTHLQLREVILEFDLIDKIAPFTRCIECNTPLEKVTDKEGIRLKVPYFVFRTHDEFSRCPSCGRIYWKGTHTEAMSKRILRILGPELSEKLKSSLS